ncbi:MAG: bifunctional (p)ppGpp synthetase/guanosine-3',5'-bis(diphosphate) 3'-pyrophosphohydrolase [Candidatus Liptonbacteria bacterium]|nr:bifunctional (p)ppGpp synthetase/guanosine-3',5'-bis(diphosphate) 3'-pyrophosphohydrolase [Candidatus Liptonbacteria bacterium]
MTVRETAQKNPKGLIGKAYSFAENAHRGQKRKNGEPYFNHVLLAAETLNQWRMDDETIAAGLLHDVVEDTTVTEEELKKAFGEDIAFLVAGVTKLSRIKYRGTEAKAENLRKMIMAISQDLRVVFIKLADRLHNMKTLSALPQPKQKRIALETSDIYAAIAYRLGMWELSGELQDLAFPYIHPAEYKWLNDHVADEYETRRKYLELIKPALGEALSKAGIKPLSMDFRAKRYYSLYQKLLRHEMDMSRVYDLVALRLIFKTIPECYAALGIINNLWRPLPGRIKDYIALPKPNNYRSLHTTVIGPDGRYVEIQMRTKEMHDENEFGIAAHWFYKSRHIMGFFRKKPPLGETLAAGLTWLRQLREWQEKREHDSISSEEFVESMKAEFFKDRIFAITPKGDVMDLPTESTPVDFAYNIHTEIGNNAIGSKINGKIMPLDTQLKSGDMVEILTQKNKRPSEDWLKFVKTSIARDHIRTALREKRKNMLEKRPASKIEMHLTLQNRLGLTKDISGIIARSHVHITSIQLSGQSSGNFSSCRIGCETTDKGKIEKVILKLKKLKEIKEISYKLV